MKAGNLNLKLSNYEIGEENIMFVAKVKDNAYNVMADGYMVTFKYKNNKVIASNGAKNKD